MDMDSPEGPEVINLLECLFCHQIMAPPIYLCESAHNVCSSCRGQLSNCPSCERPVTDQRNVLAERLAEKLPYFCSNHKMGCKEKMLLRDLPFHEATCPHRLYSCVPCRPRCKWRGRRFQVLEHMKEEHKELVWVKAYNSLVYENFDHKTDHSSTHILSSYREVFWCHSKRDARHGKLFEVVQYIGRKDRAANFEYEFEFYCKGNNRTAVFRNKVQAENEDLEKVYEAGDCLVMDLSALKYFVTDKRQLFCNLKIERVK